MALTFDADLTALMRRRLVSGKVKSYDNKALIDELRALHVPATMFLTGMWMEQYPEVTRELAADPLLELGTHTYTTVVSPSTATPSGRSPGLTCSTTYGEPSYSWISWIRTRPGG